MLECVFKISFAEWVQVQKSLELTRLLLKNIFLYKTEPVFCDPRQVRTTSLGFSSFSVIGENTVVHNSQDF